jgi:hypothetical protein
MLLLDASTKEDAASPLAPAQLLRESSEGQGYPPTGEFA